MTKSELMVENRQLKKKVADIERLHADAIENWKDEMEEVAHLKADLEKQMVTTNEYANWAESLQDRVKELEGALGALGAIGDGYCFCSHSRGPSNVFHEPECLAARAALDNGRERCP